MDNGISFILEIMRGFGLLGGQANLLVIGTSKSDLAWNLYNYLKDKNFQVDNRPKNNYYDFIFISKEVTTVNREVLLEKLRNGGIILLDLGESNHNKLIEGRYLQINKQYGILGHERKG